MKDIQEKITITTDLSLNVLSLIFETLCVLNEKQMTSKKVIRKRKKRKKYRQEHNFYAFRLVCCKWNRAAKMSTTVWNSFLKRIGPNSVHKTYSSKKYNNNSNEFKNWVKKHIKQCTNIKHYNNLVSYQKMEYVNCIIILAKEACDRRDRKIKKSVW